MKLFFKRIVLRSKEIETRYDNVEIKCFYAQLLKMKKKRPHISPKVLLHKCYPNAKKAIQEIIDEYENSVNSAR